MIDFNRSNFSNFSNLTSSTYHLTSLHHLTGLHHLTTGTTFVVLFLAGFLFLFFLGQWTTKNMFFAQS